MNPAAPTHINANGIEVVLFDRLSLLKSLFPVKEVIKQIKLEAAKGGALRPKLLVFPETIFGKTAIERQKGKRFAELVHSAIMSHGNIFVFYSIIEKGIGGTFTNSGYLIKPTSEKNKRPYLVYPKLATYDNGEATTEFEKYVAKVNGMESKRVTSKVYKMAGRIRQFPRIELQGKTIELRVCADVRKQDDQDLPRPRKNVKLADIIIVPAETFLVYPYERAGMARELAPGGLIIINDPVNFPRIMKKNALTGELKITNLKKRWPRRFVLNRSSQSEGSVLRAAMQKPNFRFAKAPREAEAHSLVRPPRKV
ncbi:Uncharacterised protein [uncultured archaeon]|nr:Uncharacterised protein [uncultured archaeon]